MLWWTFQNAIVTAAMAAIVWIVARLLRLSPAARHALWLVVLLKFLTPPLVQWPWAISNPLRPAAQEQSAILPLMPFENSIEPTVRPTFSPGAPLPPRKSIQPPINASHVSAAPGASSVAPPTRMISPADPAPASRLKSEDWFPSILWCLCVVWIVGSMAVLLMHGIRIIRMRRLVRVFQPADPAFAALVRALGEQMNIGPVDCRIVSGISSPMVCCLFRPVLLWPANLYDLPNEARRALLVHELAHLKRRDHWIGWLELMAHCIWWWNPVFWFTRRQLRQNAELACDAWVTNQLPGSRRAYASALVAVCETISLQTSSRPLLALGVSTGGRRLLERRLAMILRDRVPSRLSRAAFFFVGLLALAAIPAWSQRSDSGSEAPGASPTPEPKQQALTDDAARLLDELQVQLSRRNREIQDAVAERNRGFERLRELMEQYRRSGQDQEADAIAERLNRLSPKSRQSVRVTADPGTLVGYRDRAGESFYFDVVGKTGQTIWGTEVYTDDSPLAVAAVHAGVLRDGDRGIVKVTILPGLGSFVGTTLNGVESNSYGKWGGSYHVEATSLSPQPAPPRTEEPANEGPINLPSLRDHVGQVFTFDVVGSREGAVWGSGIYTDDSSLAAAAVHAGILHAGQRGRVHIRILPGQGHYTGSNRNGIVSSSWENWQGSFEFVRPRYFGDPPVGF